MFLTLYNKIEFFHRFDYSIVIISNEVFIFWLSVDPRKSNEQRNKLKKSKSLNKQSNNNNNKQQFSVFWY